MPSFAYPRLTPYHCPANLHFKITRININKIV